MKLKKLRIAASLQLRVPIVPPRFLGFIRYCGSTGDGPVHREVQDGRETPDAQAETLRQNWRLTRAPFDEASRCEHTQMSMTLRSLSDVRRCRT
ncbi:hypothetical protein [Bradyrhizobium huanghuaihaiense]